MIRILILTLFFTTTLAGSGLPPSPYVYTIGKAERSIDADQVAIQIFASGTDTDYQSALSKMLSESSTIFSILEAAQVSTEDIASHKVSTEPQFSRDDSRRVITGYAAVQEFNVTIRDVSRAADLLSRILEKGKFAVQVGDPRSTKRKDVERELTAEAIKDARLRADEIATQTGMKVASVHAVSPVSFGEIEGSFLGGERRLKIFSAGRMNLKLIFPKIRVEVAVHVIFTIEKP